MLTDGQDGHRSYDTVLKTIQEEKITLSCVAIGSGADQNTLTKMAENGGGRYYYSDASQKLPRIFAQEIFLSAKQYLIQEMFVPVIGNSHEIIQTIFSEGSPPLYGYIAATPKQTATVILKSHRDDPILTIWQYGLGKAIAWNTDASNEWTRDFAGWDPYAQLWKNMIDSTLSDSQLDGDHLEIVSHSSSATVIYEPEEASSSTQITAIVTDEAGEQQEILFYATAPGKYEGEIPMSKQGVYRINIRNQQGEEIVKNINTAAAMQYSAEYRPEQTSTAFEQFLAQIGGIQIETPDQVFETILTGPMSKQDLSDLFLWTAAILFLIDVIVRRWNLDYMEMLQNILQRAGKIKRALRTPPAKNPDKRDSLQGIDTDALLQKKKDRQ